MTTTNILRRAGPGRLSSEEAEGLADRLLDAATAVFLAKGYAAATMEGIARTAGASTKTLYLRYRNKGELLAAVIRRLCSRALQEPLDALRGEHASPQKILKSFGVRLAVLVGSAEPLALYRLAVAEAQTAPELADLYHQGPGRAVAALTPLMEEWVRQGSADFPVPPAKAAALFIEMVAGFARKRAILQTPLTSAEIDEHVEACVKMILAATRP